MSKSWEMYSKAILDREVKEEILDVNESLDKQATTPEAQAADIKIHEALANLPDVLTEFYNDASTNPWSGSSSNIDEAIEEGLIQLNSNAKFVNAGVNELSNDAINEMT
jgi:hypothetical protein